MSDADKYPYPDPAMLLAQDAIREYKSLIANVRRCERRAQMALERLELLYEILELTPDVGIDPYDPFNEKFIKITEQQGRFWGRICLPKGFREARRKQTPWHKELCEFVADCATREEKILKYQARINELNAGLEGVEGLPEPTPITFEDAERSLERAFIIDDHSEYRCPHQEAFGGQCLCTKKGPTENDPPDPAGEC
ncbi:hypothetical protein [uncultured Desulfobacter sp.]|uniref:hypothetical protein n=1 Tax=uncultured Desulfobacter sp. TaxID=240139 RepID=UPI002AAB7E59|nr:hypothetical protein [uncultured Desulfobacter sp.]